MVNVIGSDETKQRLIDAAGQIFADKGFAAATVRDICEKAKANIAAVNYYFGDKQRLYNEAVRHAHCIRGASDAPIWPLDASRECKLRAFIGEMMASMWDHDRPTWELELVMQEMARPTEACVELVKDFIGPKFKVLMSIVDEFFPKGAAATGRHLAAFSVVAQCLLYRFHRPVGKLLVGNAEYASYRVDQLADHIARFSIAGLIAAADAAAVELNAAPNDRREVAVP